MAMSVDVRGISEMRDEIKVLTGLVRELVRVTRHAHQVSVDDVPEASDE